VPVSYCRLDLLLPFLFRLFGAIEIASFDTPFVSGGLILVSMHLFAVSIGDFVTAFRDCSQVPVSYCCLGPLLSQPFLPFCAS